MPDQLYEKGKSEHGLVYPVQVTPLSLNHTLGMLEVLEDTNAPLRIIRGALRYAAQPYIDGLERRVSYLNPDDNDYHLRDHMGMQLERKSVRVTAAQYRVGPKRVTAVQGSTYSIVGGLSSNKKAPNYAQIVEAQTHFMMRTYSSDTPKVIARFGDRVVSRTKAAVKRAQIKKAQAAKR